MACTSLSSSSAHFIGSRVITGESYSQHPAVSVKFRPLRVSAAAATCESSTEERTRGYAPPRHIASPASLYEVLGIQMGATCQEIKTAYRRLARVLHPDVAAAESNTTAYEFMRVHEAYETLSDPEKRADYDRTLFRRQRRPLSSPFAMSGSGVAMATYSSPPSSGFSGYTGRTWETDQCW
ncbi:hypothetical protein ACOSP7_011142 [Xanthoceras sorbifolium]|uniref:J domain-containing protein n=1 Tax=Xanthoceras sorbifolium TaxID=99658 RepID=A0ABQ8HRV9_9ROSI|nr:hypothetical protein JRO89_XS07G0020900 [Xanthoceras sorbifolium]